MEREIIDTALKNLQKGIALNVHWNNNGPLDGELTIKQNLKTYFFVTQIKKEVRQHHINQIMNRPVNHQIMIVAERIIPKAKEELRERKIAYLEENGNIYINLPDFFLFIDTNKQGLRKKETRNRAFTKTGLKVVFNFLMDQELVNQPQRVIAEITGVGLGNIPQVINGLKETGYLLQLDKKHYTWENKAELLNRWITDYETTLRPAITKTKYRLKTPWKDINLNKGLTTWGGEPAADILTNHLRPEKFTLYTKENQVDLIRQYKLLPEEHGELTVYEMFWKQKPEEKTAPPLLIYTELILEGGKRNKETAEKVFNEYIRPKL